MTVFHVLCLFLSVFGSINVKSDEEFCSVDNKNSCLSNNMSHELTDLDNKYKEYYNEIEQAEKNFKECNVKNCACYKNIIQQGLKPFNKDGISKKLIDISMDYGVIYQIIDGKLYRQRDCMFPSRCAGVEHFILKLTNNISDTEMIINTRDYPQSSKHFEKALPIFSFSKTTEFYDIMYPAWSFWEGGPAISLYPRGLGRWDQHRKSLDKTSKDVPWEEKINKAFFRGSRTSAERDYLVLLSRKNPDLVNAQYTKNQAWKSDADTLYEPPASEVSLEEHCKYKYLFNYRGVAASFRHKHLFLCNSLVFHVGDEWVEFYYFAMKPWIHYIPVAKDASQDDLEKLIRFAEDNQNIAKKIAQRGRDFIWEKLRMSDVNCYWKKLLQKYLKLLTYKPTLRENLKEIKVR